MPAGFGRDRASEAASKAADAGGHPKPQANERQPIIFSTCSQLTRLSTKASRYFGRRLR